MAANRTRDYYEVLGVPRTASTEELQRAYRALARRHHPDVNKDPDAEERFKELNQAYHVLADPKTRQRYDRYGAEFGNIPEDFDERYARAGAGAGAAGGRRDDGASGFGRGPGGFRYGRGGEGAVDLEDLFGDLFGRRGGVGAEGLAGADQEAELPLSFEDAFRGGRRTLNVAGRDYEVNIPPGVTDGSRIRLAGQGGGRGRAHGPPGDLYLVVRVLPDTRFRLDGRDITVDLPVAPWEGALGASVRVPTPAGAVTVSVPAGTSTGRRLRLRGQGMPNPRGQPGDLYAEVKIMVPSTLSDAERELYQELSRVSSFNPREGGQR